MRLSDAAAASPLTNIALRARHIASHRRLLEATDKRAVAAQPRFLSSLPAATILARVAEALTSMGADVRC